MVGALKRAIIIKTMKTTEKAKPATSVRLEGDVGSLVAVVIAPPPFLPRFIPQGYALLPSR
jgi:hypothetical protein